MNMTSLVSSGSSVISICDVGISSEFTFLNEPRTAPPIPIPADELSCIVSSTLPVLVTFSVYSTPVFASVVSLVVSTDVNDTPCVTSSEVDVCV